MSVKCSVWEEAVTLLGRMAAEVRVRARARARVKVRVTLKHYECYNEPHYERNIHYEFRGAHNTH